MTRYTTLLFFVVLAAMTGARALSVDNARPGGLEALVPAPSDVVSLAVTGSIDASDFEFIAREMRSLRSLDLSAAMISAYDGEPINDVRHYRANTLPAMLMAGSGVAEFRFPASLEAIDEGALAGTAIEEVDLPSSVKSVGDGAFAGCMALRAARLGGASLGSGAFAGCTALESVATEAAVLPERGFSGCAALESVHAPAVEALGARVFEGCVSLRAFDFPGKLASVGERAFACSGLETADLSQCRVLASVGAGAFASCGSLRVLAFPDKTVDTGHALAMGSTGLQSVLMPEGPLPAYALAGDAAADATEALSRASEVGEYALQGVSGASGVRLPASLEYLGDGAMEGMTGLRHIDASALERVPELGEAVWSGVRQGEVVLQTSDEMADAFLAAGQWQEFKISTSGTTLVGDEAGVGHIRVWFEGMVLIAECRGDAVKSLRLHDTAGRLLAILTLTPDGRAAADTSRWTERIYVVSALDTDDNNLTTIKIARNG